jgi:hypothetical protein
VKLTVPTEQMPAVRVVAVAPTLSHCFMASVMAS